MKNRNMLIFVVLSVLLLGGYNFLMTRLNPHPPVVAQVQPAEPVPVQPAGSSPAPAAVPGAPVAAVDPMARFSLKNDTLELTWRKGDGALVQVKWSDGTKFFTEAKLGKDGAEIDDEAGCQDRLAILGCIEAQFEHDGIDDRDGRGGQGDAAQPTGHDGPVQ